MPANDWHPPVMPVGGAPDTTLPRIHPHNPIFEAAANTVACVIVGGGGHAHPPPLVWNNETFVLVSLRSNPDIVALMLTPIHSPLLTGIR